MGEGKKKYGDEGFIHLVGSQQEKPFDGNINDGYITFDNEKIIFTRQTILNDSITMLMPEMRKTMSDKETAEKYGTKDCPDIVYQLMDDGIHLTLTSQADLQSEDDEIPSIRDLVKISVMKEFPDSRVIESAEIMAIERTIAYFDFNAETYNMFFFFSLNGITIMGSIECEKDAMDDWKPIFLQMLKSLEELQK